MTSSHRIVSSESEKLILVDENDRETGYESKALCHDGDGLLHRAFSIFLFNEAGELLLQQRSRSKRLWGGYWSNTCCSHPRRHETMPQATSRRLHDELGVSADLEHVYRFVYRARFGDLGSEFELCHVYLGRMSGSPSPNGHEIEALRYVSADVLAAELAAAPDRFSPWLKLEWEALRGEHRDALRRYCGSGQPT